MSNIRPIEIVYGNCTLRGARFIGGDRGSVLLVHGFSDTRTGSGRMFVDLARRLVRAGFSVISFDRAGHGESDGRFLDVNVPDEIEQLAVMLDHLDRPAHCIGHSLGAMELAQLASREPARFLSLSLLAPAASSVDEIANGMIMGEPFDRITTDEPFDLGGQALGPAFVEGMRDFDPYAGIERYRGPAFLHHGEQDEIVALACSRRYRDIWPQARLTTYRNTDHGWHNLQARQRLFDVIEADLMACEKG
ncbi:alpha/beta fold hydrolase [Croceicoccus hydrothermalis]|uniref:alpha/beta fold hydrolase n=1 Tax=Croceicoccus hydrothermalis TaxID=2867964 RepID=UPI001EFB77BC|nr:alpha/beta fold hydrolase [Croceicoccus hydrothermalis]